VTGSFYYICNGGIFQEKKNEKCSGSLEIVDLRNKLIKMERKLVRRSGRSVERRITFKVITTRTVLAFFAPRFYGKTAYLVSDIVDDTSDCTLINSAVIGLQQNLSL